MLLLMSLFKEVLTSTSITMKLLQEGPELPGGVGGCDIPQKFHSEVHPAEFCFSRWTKIFLDTKQYCRQEKTKIFVAQNLLGSWKNMLSLKYSRLVFAWHDRS